MVLEADSFPATVEEQGSFLTNLVSCNQADQCPNKPKFEFRIRVSNCGTFRTESDDIRLCAMDGFICGQSSQDPNQLHSRKGGYDVQKQIAPVSGFSCDSLFL